MHPRNATGGRHPNGSGPSKHPLLQQGMTQRTCDGPNFNLLHQGA